MISLRIAVLQSEARSRENINVEEANREEEHQNGDQDELRNEEIEMIDYTIFREEDSLSSHQDSILEQV